VPAFNDVGPARPTVAVVGAGIAGLSAAYRLSLSPTRPSVVVFESQDRVGGLLNTIQRDGFLIEEAADSLVLSQAPWLAELCRELGVIDELVSVQQVDHPALLLRNDRLLPMPSGFMLMSPTRIWPLVTTRILTLVGKLRLAMEPLIASQARGEESIAEFASRRLGRQAYERLVRPLVESIYGGDPSTLSLAAVLPRFAEMERTFGSLFHAARCQNRGTKRNGAREAASHSQLQAPRGGMARLVEALARPLPDGCIRLSSQVERLTRLEDGRWRLICRGNCAGTFTADAVIVATPANHAARVLGELDRRIKDALDVEYSQTVHVTLGFDRAQVTRPARAHGLFLPREAGWHVRSVIICSEKFPERAPPGAMQFRVALQPAAPSNSSGVGNASPSIVDWGDERLGDVAAAEIAPFFGVRGRAVFRYVVRHRQALPQYRLGHGDRVGRIERLIANLPGLELAGAAYHGIGLPQCVRSGRQAADRVLQFLSLRV
jgi:oxygen-dependent protoporphyrinogen oxidase